MDECLSIKGVIRRFSGIVAVNHISFAVAKGEVVGLIGPNGSGKTTLLNVINGHLYPDGGSVFIQGSRSDGLPPETVAKKGVARSFQVPRTFKRLSVLQNMLIPSHAVTGRGGKAAIQQAEEILKALGLHEARNLMAGSLSGGHQKLLDFATCFMSDPKILLLDEPFAGLSLRMKETMREYIHDQNRKGKTFLIVSHDIPAISDLCKRLIVLNAGSIIADGGVEEVLNSEEVIEAYLGR